LTIHPYLSFVVATQQSAASPTSAFCPAAARVDAPIRIGHIAYRRLVRRAVRFEPGLRSMNGVSTASSRDRWLTIDHRVPRTITSLGDGTRRI
jgi:hypothetical protein